LVFSRLVSRFAPLLIDFARRSAGNPNRPNLFVLTGRNSLTALLMVVMVDRLLNLINGYELSEKQQKNKRSKPHPEIFLKAAESTGFHKSECMVIEDSTNGIKAAHAAGIFCAGFKSEHSSGQDYTLANVVVSSFEELSFSKHESFFINSI